MTREQAIIYIQRRLLDIRKLERIVMSEKFTRACDLADEQQQYDLQKAIEDMNAGILRRWIKKILAVKQNLEDYTISELRMVARRYTIRQYQSMTRSNLIEAIEDEQRRRVITGS